MHESPAMSEKLLDPAAVAAAVATVRARILELAPGRDVHLIAVTKGFGVDAIDAALAAGCTTIGENYAQELQRKMNEIRSRPVGSPRPVVHFIGQLQTNKVRTIAAFVDVWQTVDRSSLVNEIARRAPNATVFVQVDVTEEAGKGGCRPEAVPLLVEECRRAGLVVDGLMTVGPTSTDATLTAHAFEEVRCLADRAGLENCSMGMSGDYESAIIRGATHVRIGSALFGARPQPRAPIG
jgi:pyridoxal phosphate enzyme (YggS family)